MMTNGEKQIPSPLFFEKKKKKKKGGGGGGGVKEEEEGLPSLVRTTRLGLRFGPLITHTYARRGVKEGGGTPYLLPFCLSLAGATQFASTQESTGAGAEQMEKHKRASASNGFIQTLWHSFLAPFPFPQEVICFWTAPLSALFWENEMEIFL